MESEETRRIDMLGRIAIPRDIREKSGWKKKDVIEFYYENDTIIMRRLVMED